MTVDLRYIDGIGAFRGALYYSFSGTTLTISRTDEDGGWPMSFFLRAYMPTEDIPDFTSTVYTYWGLLNEEAPKDVTEVNFAPSVTTINECAFLGCKSLVRVTIPDYVTTIEYGAFWGCYSLKSLRLPRNLERIGESAFRHCRSLEAVCLPPTITHIGDQLQITEILLRVSSNCAYR